MIVASNTQFTHFAVKDTATILVRQSKSFLEVAQQSLTRKVAAQDGKACINISMTDARDFHRHFHVSDDLDARSFPSERVVIRIFIVNLASNSKSCDHFQSSSVKHRVCSFFMKEIHDEYVFHDGDFAALADFKLLVGKDRS